MAWEYFIYNGEKKDNTPTFPHYWFSIIQTAIFFGLLCISRESLSIYYKKPTLTVSLGSPHFRKYFRRRPRAGLIPTFEEFLQFVSAAIPLNMTAALRKQRRINNHWKPVFLNCAPCSQPYEIIVKMETFDQDVGYIRRRLGLVQLDSSRSSHVGQLLAALSGSHKGGHHLNSRHVDQLSADLNTSYHEDRLGIDQLSPLSSSRHVGKLSADRSKSQLSADLSTRHEGQLSADQSSIHHVGQKSADRPSKSAAVEAFRLLDSKLVERIYQIYEPDFLLFGYSPHKYVNVAQNQTNKQNE
jgi:hypothetical protein